MGGVYGRCGWEVWVGGGEWEVGVEVWIGGVNGSASVWRGVALSPPPAANDK